MLFRDDSVLLTSLLPRLTIALSSCPDQRSLSYRDPVGVTAHDCLRCFRCNTYKKHGGRAREGAPVVVNQESDKNTCLITPSHEGNDHPPGAQSSDLKRRIFP